MVALEISTERGPSNHTPGNASVDPTFKPRECPVECRDNPWTFGATRFRSTLPRHHQEVYGQDSGRNGQVPKLVDFPAKSPRSVLGHGLLHGAYCSLSNPVVGHQNASTASRIKIKRLERYHSTCYLRGALQLRSNHGYPCLCSAGLPAVAFSATSETRPGSRRSSPATRCLQAEAAPAQTGSPRSAVLDCPPPAMGGLVPSPDHRQAGDRGFLASCRIPVVLAVAVSKRSKIEKRPRKSTDRLGLSRRSGRRESAQALSPSPKVGKLAYRHCPTRARAGPE